MKSRFNYILYVVCISILSLALLSCVNPKPYVRTVDKVPKAFERKNAEAIFYLKNAVTEANREVSSYSLYYLGKYYKLLLDGGTVSDVQDVEALLIELEAFFSERYLSEKEASFPPKNLIIQAMSYGLLTRPIAADFFSRVFADEQNDITLAYALRTIEQNLEKWLVDWQKLQSSEEFIAEKNQSLEAAKQKFQLNLENLADLVFPVCQEALASASSLVFESGLHCLNGIAAISDAQRLMVSSVLAESSEASTTSPLKQLWLKKKRLEN